MSAPPPLVLDAVRALTGEAPLQVRDDGVWFVSAGHDAADALARELRGAHRETGWWPLLVHEPDVDLIWEAALDAGLPCGAEALADIASDDLEDLLAPYAEEVDLPVDVDPKPAVAGPVDNVGSLEWLGLLLMPCPSAWQSLPFVGFGAFGACPEPTEHGAVARWLFEQHGSDPVAVGADTVVFRSLRPVADEHLTAAVRILLAYCTTLVEQERDPDDLAGLLAAGVSRLSLWWD